MVANPKRKFVTAEVFKALFQNGYAGSNSDSSSNVIYESD